MAFQKWLQQDLPSHQFFPRNNLAFLVSGGSLCLNLGGLVTIVDVTLYDSGLGHKR